MPATNYHNQPEYWVGRLAMLTALTAPKLDQPDRKMADETLGELVRSDAIHDSLRETLRRQMGEKR